MFPFNNANAVIERIMYLSKWLWSAMTLRYISYRYRLFPSDKWKTITTSKFSLWSPGEAQADINIGTRCNYRFKLCTLGEMKFNLILCCFVTAIWPISREEKHIIIDNRKHHIYRRLKSFKYYRCPRTCFGMYKVVKKSKYNLTTGVFLGCHMWLFAQILP